MRSTLLLFLSSWVVAGCGGDYTAAVADVTFTPWEEENPAGEALDPSQVAGGELDDQAVDPAPDRVGEDPVDDPADDPLDPGTDPDVADDPPADDPPAEDEPYYDPDWTENDDPLVEGCLETFPAICNKWEECGAEQPIAGILGSFCPFLFDAIAPMLELGCAQVEGLLGGLAGGVELPIIGGGLETIIMDLLQGCIENFQCDPEYLAEFGAKFGEVLQLFGGSATGGGGGDIGAALPALLELAEMCGGLGSLLPF